MFAFFTKSAASLEVEQPQLQTQVGFKNVLIGDSYSKISATTRLKCSVPNFSLYKSKKSSDKHLNDLYRKAESVERKMFEDRRCELLDRHTIAGMSIGISNIIFFDDRLEKIELTVFQRNDRKLDYLEEGYSYKSNVDVLREGLVERYGNCQNLEGEIAGRPSFSRHSPKNAIHIWTLPSATIRMEYFPIHPASIHLEYKSASYDKESHRRFAVAESIRKQIRTLEEEIEATTRAKRAKDF